MNSYKEDIGLLLEKAVGTSKDEIIPLISIPPANIDADFSLPCFTLARLLKKSPVLIAKELADSLELPNHFEKVVAVNGYLNFLLNQELFSEKLLKEVYSQKSDYGKNDLGKGKTITLDYSSPNMGKELAFHHLRGTMLGNSLSHLLMANGYHVVRINHLGDWGTSYGKLIHMYLLRGLPTDEQSLKEITIEELNKLYQAFVKELENNPETEDKARLIFQQLEQGDKLYTKLWQSFKNTTLNELKRIYAILGVEFDSYKGEAAYTQDAIKLIEELKTKAIVTPSRGAFIVDLEKHELPPLMMQKSDGSTLYATRDICAARSRQSEYKFHKNLYVVDNGQSLHFKQFFIVLKQMGMEWATDCEHVPFGLILNKNKEGKWEKGKTRAGHSSLLKDVIEQATTKITTIIEDKNPDLTNKKTIAQNIAVGALVFNDLKTKRINDVKFEWDKVLAFEGDTGPYVMNAYVRLCSILRKSSIEEGDENPFTKTLQFKNLKDKAALNLIHVLAQFPEKVKTAGKSYEPYHLGQYALSVAEKVHQFIHFCRVLNSDEEYERLYLVFCTRIVLKNTMNLLGIPLVESM